MKENTSSGHEWEQKRHHPNENRSQADHPNSRDTDKEEGNMQHGVVGGAPEYAVNDTDQKHKEAHRSSDNHQ